MPEDEDGGVFIGRYEGPIQVLLTDENDEQEHKAGSLRLFVVNADQALARGHSLFDLLDREEETAQYLDLLDPDGPEGFSQDLVDLLADDLMLGCNMLILDSIELDTRYRGQGLALRVITAAIHRFGLGCRFAVLKPFPLELKNDPDKKKVRAATLKLAQYYARAAFERVPGTDLLVRNLMNQGPMFESA